MTGMSERQGHESRTRESKISRSQNIAKMRLLLKDHKVKLCTRPVVSGCDSHKLSLSNMVSDLLEAVCNSVEDPSEVISAEIFWICGNLMTSMLNLRINVQRLCFFLHIILHNLRKYTQIHICTKHIGAFSGNSTV